MFTGIKETGIQEATRLQLTCNKKNTKNNKKQHDTTGMQY